MKPILRWAGGKIHLATNLARLAPPRWERYIEPMLGAGALYLQLVPKRALLADINEELIHFYQTLRDQPEALIARMVSLKASRRTYYRFRNQSPKDDLARAARFAYLNRLCWNGIYRVNKEGRFNVPMGDRLPPTLWRTEHLETVAAALRHANLIRADFRETLAKARPGDFVYLDPPYPRGTAKGLGFARYSVDGFDESDHRDLAQLIEILTRKNVLVMTTVALAPFVNSLYPRSLRRTTFEGRSLVSGSPSGRRIVHELVMTNYDPPGQV